MGLCQNQCNFSALGTLPGTQAHCVGPISHFGWRLFLLINVGVVDPALAQVQKSWYWPTIASPKPCLCLYVLGAGLLQEGMRVSLLKKATHFLSISAYRGETAEKDTQIWASLISKSSLCSRFEPLATCLESTETCACMGMGFFHWPEPNAYCLLPQDLFFTVRVTGHPELSVHYWYAFNSL